MYILKKKIIIDKQGYLKNFNDWDKNIAFYIAKKENINITTDHWKVIFYLRNFYLKFNIYPSMRIFIEDIVKKENKKKFNSFYLFNLFPKSPIYQGGKIAGLPKTSKCL